MLLLEPEEEQKRDPGKSRNTYPLHGEKDKSAKNMITRTEG